jgi:hypothetical protein
VYDLFAVVNHTGTLLGGHYTAYVKHPLSGAWYLYNDTVVRSVAGSSGAQPVAAAAAAARAVQISADAAPGGSDGGAAAGAGSAVRNASEPAAAASSPRAGSGSTIGAADTPAAACTGASKEEGEEAWLRRVVERLRQQHPHAATCVAPAAAHGSKGDAGPASDGGAAREQSNGAAAAAPDTSGLSDEALQEVLVTPSAYLLFYRRRGT